MNSCIRLNIWQKSWLHMWVSLNLQSYMDAKNLCEHIANAR